MRDARKPLRWSVALLACTFATAGCQLLVNLDGLEDRSCPPGEKACGDECVSESNPATGCNDPRCNPCAPPHANAICDQRNRCSFTREDCVKPWDACNIYQDDGCETDLAHDKRNCGECGHVCEDRPNAIAAGCWDGNCVVGKCLEGWEDCDHDPLNGCEREIWTDLQCASCDLPCPDGSSCNRGVCGPPPP